MSFSASASPSRLPPDATVTYSDTLTNTGDVTGSGVRLTHTLPTGFTYVAGSTGIYRDGILIGRTEPTIAGHTLSWSGLTVPPRRGDGLFRHQHDGAGPLRDRLPSPGSSITSAT